MKHSLKSIAIGAALFTLGGIGCGSDDTGPLGDVDALIILQRPRRNDTGDIFQYTSYTPGARLIKLSPPTADGTITPICCTNAGPEYANVDINGYDLSFDAKTIVFSARLGGGDNDKYGLYLLTLETGAVTKIKSDPGADYVSPIFLPGDKIAFTTNAVVEEGAHQHVDEYERGLTIQLGRINIDGSNEERGARNLSHRTAPSLTSDGRIIFTQWDHLGDKNEGNLMLVNQDLQNLREAFGKEGSSVSNSTLKAREISPGRFIAIGTARNRTLNAGTLVDIRIGKVENHDGVVSAPTLQSEANATANRLSPDVPTDNEPSASTIGRYYDAYPLNAKDKPDLLVSWADGPVESGVLALGHQTADFGIYLYDTARQQRRPILDDHTMWDVFAMPLRTRTAPPLVQSAQDVKVGNGQTLIGSLDVRNSTLHDFTGEEIYGVRVMEGFSSEEGFEEDFGTTELEGHANLGVAPLSPDGKSWSALIPANIPIHLQTVDKFGMSLFNESVWFSGRPGEARICGGCHEDRARTTNVAPGALDNVVIGAAKLMADTPRAARLNMTPTALNGSDVVGVAWNKLVQPILTANCVTGCHDAANSAMVAGYTIIDTTGVNPPLTWALNLTGDDLPPAYAVAAGGGAYSSSYFSFAGPDMEALERGHLMVQGTVKKYMNPLDARGSIAIKLLNPTQVFPKEDAGVHAFNTVPHLMAKGRPELSPRDMYILTLAADMGALYYSRENNPHTGRYQ